MKTRLLFLSVFLSANLFGQSNNYSLEFDGQDGFIEINNLSDDFDDFDDFSFLGFFKTDDSFLTGQELIFATNDINYDKSSIWLGVRDNQILVQYFDGDTQSDYLYYGNNVTDGVWHSIGLIINNQNNMSIYLDGLEVGSESSVQVDFSVAEYYSFGQEWDPGASSDFFVGNLDDISIWNTALSEGDVLDYINCPPIGNEMGLVGFWNFEEGSGDSVIDLSANSNNGNLNGGVFWDEDVIDYDCTSSLTELTTSKNLIQIIDLMGRETSFKPNTTLIYVYDDGSIEKVFSVEY